MEKKIMCMYEMNERVIKQLYDNASLFNSYDRKYMNQLREKSKIKVEIGEKLKEQLTEKQYELVEEYFNAEDEINEMVSFEKFVFALRFGMELNEEIN